MHFKGHQNTGRCSSLGPLEADWEMLDFQSVFWRNMPENVSLLRNILQIHEPSIHTSTIIGSAKFRIRKYLLILPGWPGWIQFISKVFSSRTIGGICANWAFPLPIWALHANFIESLNYEIWGSWVIPVDQAGTPRMTGAYVWNRKKKRAPKLCDASNARVLMGLSKKVGLTV